MAVPPRWPIPMASNASVFRNSRAYSLLGEQRSKATDEQLRLLLFQYLRHFFAILPSVGDELDEVMLFIQLSRDEGTNALCDELPRIREEVDRCAWEYYESLNEAADAIRCLIEDAPLSVNDVISSIEHVWNAYLCNLHPDEFVADEDNVICTLVEKIGVESSSP